jgi:hypothetical protein
LEQVKNLHGAWQSVFVVVTFVIIIAVLKLDGPQVQTGALRKSSLKLPAGKAHAGLCVESWLALRLCHRVHGQAPLSTVFVSLPPETLPQSISGILTSD